MTSPTPPASSAATAAQRTQIIVMSMSRSGTSLTTSLVASLLGHQPQCWRGGAAAYPTDHANRLGYFERNDVIRLNHATLTSLGSSWLSFPTNHVYSPQAWRAAPSPPPLSLWIISINPVMTTTMSSQFLRQHEAWLVGLASAPPHAAAGRKYVLNPCM